MRLTSPRTQLDKWFEKAKNGIYRLTLIDTPFSFFRPWCLIDDTAIQCCRPGSGPETAESGSRRNNLSKIIQESFCSGYFCVPGLKFQTALLPNSLRGSIFGSSMNHNNIGVLNLSVLVPYLVSLLRPLPSRMFPSAVGGDIFRESAVIVNGKEKDLKGIRQGIELHYGQYFNQLKLMSQKKL